jgi:hypothetical protein
MPYEKLLASRRILNHTAPNTDVLNRHYVGLNEGDVLDGLVAIQGASTGLMTAWQPE